uniref:Uncharacterized protein n=1 Tax=Vitis vinifera TaxID=29760 RepID=A5BD34_VITVI|nr:hypothetical protein VITISV_014794 [Vitis vinifera]
MQEVVNLGVQLRPPRRRNRRLRRSRPLLRLTDIRRQIRPRRRGRDINTRRRIEEISTEIVERVVKPRSHLIFLHEELSAGLIHLSR